MKRWILSGRIAEVEENFKRWHHGKLSFRFRWL